MKDWENIWQVLLDSVNTALGAITVTRGGSTYPFFARVKTMSEPENTSCDLAIYVKIENGGQIPVHVKTINTPLLPVAFRYNRGEIGLAPRTDHSCLTVTFATIGEHDQACADSEDMLGKIRAILGAYPGHDRVVASLEADAPAKKPSGHSPFTGKTVTTNCKFHICHIRDLHTLGANARAAAESILRLIGPTFELFALDIAAREYLTFV